MSLPTRDQYYLDIYVSNPGEGGPFYFMYDGKFQYSSCV
jgi:hypothetical protein